jgi:tetratricopeptide (TPR) repeat protein
MIKKLSGFVLMVASIGLGFAQAPPVPAPAPGAPPPAAPGAPAAPAPGVNLQADVEKAMTDGLALMQEGKFKDAIAKVDFIKSKMSKVPENVIFLEGACYFNLADFPKAAQAFETYIKDYPTGDNLNPVKMGLGRSYLKLSKADDALKMLKEVATAAPDLKIDAGLLIAEHYKKANQPDDAIQILTSVLTEGIRSAGQVSAALMLADIYVSKGDGEKAAQLLESVRAVSTEGESVIEMNNLGQKLGDENMEKKSFREALVAYQSVRRKSEVMKLQKDRIAKATAHLALGRGNKEDIEAKIASDKALLAQLEEKGDYDATLYYRLGRCYFEMGRMWESLLAFETVVKEFKTFPQRDKCMYAMIMANAQLKRVSKAREYCEKFIADFPESEMTGQIAEMFGMLAYQQGDLQAAADAFDKILGYPKVDKARALFLRGNVLFEMQKFQEAVTTLELMKAEKGGEAYGDDATYRIALCYFYQNDFKNVKKSLADYIKNYPKGQYVVDAKYRQSFIKVQAGDIEDSMKDLLAIVNESPNDPNIAQVYSLLGDCFSNLAQKDPAKSTEYYQKAEEAYLNAVKRSGTEDVRKYALEHVNDLLVGNDKWDTVAELWTVELKRHQGKPEALKAIFWLVKALVRQNKAEDAKKMLADYIKPYISNTGLEDVEGLIQQLAALMAPKRRRVSTLALLPTPVVAPKDGEAAVVAAPEATKPEAPAPAVVTYEEVEKQFEALLTPETMTPTANIRIMFGKISLAAKMKEVEKGDKLMGIMVEVAKAEDLSPLLLSIVGDNARKKGDPEKAATCYERLRALFPGSEYADGAPVGLAEIAFEKGEFDKALLLFTEATGEKYQGSSKLLDATMGKAKTLLKLAKYEEAEKEYDGIARVKEWKSAWPESLYGLGQVKEARKDYAAAITFYQRVFIAHQKNKAWMARSYLQSARCFMLLNKPAEAKRTLQEMLKNETMKLQPEFEAAKLELQKLK